jgi:hypothetical protein
MRARLSTLAIVALIASGSSASAQYIVVDSNGTFVGNVVSGDTTAIVATQDASGIWITMELVREGFIPSNGETAYYTDPACSTTPYLQPLTGGLTPFFRLLQSASPESIQTSGDYPGDPIATMTFQSVRSISPPTQCQTTTNRLRAGPLTTFDLSRFVPPFNVVSLLKVGSAGRVFP